MRIATVVLCLFAATVATTELRAQPPYSTVRTPAPTLSQQLILEREMYRARQRTHRMEARRWLGISPQRPTDRTGFGTTNVNQYRVPAYAGPPAISFWHGPQHAVRTN